MRNLPDLRDPQRKEKKARKAVDAKKMEAVFALPLVVQGYKVLGFRAHHRPLAPNACTRNLTAKTLIPGNSWIECSGKTPTLRICISSLHNFGVQQAI